MKTLFWVSCSIVLYTYAGYPLMVAALARLRPKPWKRAPRRAPVSIVMAVHNGEAMLPWKIEHLLSLEPDIVREVVFVSDGSTDTTDQLLGAIADPRAKVVLIPQQVGKTAAVNQGVALCTGEFILFTDIRPEIQPGAITALLSNFADPTVGCCAGELIVRSTSAHDATANSVGGLYWRYEQGIRNCEAAFDSPVGVYGGFYMIRRALAVEAPDGLILDDMFQPLAIIRQGYRSVLDRSAIVVDTWPASTANEFARKVRTLAGNFQLIARAPWILSLRNRVLFQLVSHKLMRLVVPYALLLMLLSASVLATTSPFWMLIAVAEWCALAVALLSLRIRVPLLGRIGSPLGALLVLNAAAVVALYKFAFTRGPLWHIWSPTASPAKLGHQARTVEEKHA